MKRALYFVTAAVLVAAPMYVIAGGLGGPGLTRQSGGAVNGTSGTFSGDVTADRLIATHSVAFEPAVVTNTELVGIGFAGNIHMFANSGQLQINDDFKIQGGININDTMSVLPTGVTTAPVYATTETTLTIADDTAGTAPASAVAPTTEAVLLEYNDPTNASVGTISETGALPGRTLSITHTGSGGTVAFAAVGGAFVTGATCTLSVNDTLIVRYVNSAWHRIACVDN